MIVYFSGTGNTRHCAKKLAEMLGDELFELTAGLLIAPMRARVVTNDKRIVWMFPVYSWGIPPVVDNILKFARIGTPHGAMHHLVMTCGDDVGLTHKQWRKIIESRHFNTGLTFSVQMPNTYVLMKGFDVDPSDVENQKIEASEERLRYIAERIADYKEESDFDASQLDEDDVVCGRFAGIKSRLIYPWFKRHAMSPKPFHHSHSCTGCGLCAASCPMGNIIMDCYRRPVWSKKCALCLRCYHICPAHAVAYGHKTTDKGQYQRYLKNRD